MIYPARFSTLCSLEASYLACLSLLSNIQYICKPAVCLCQTYIDQLSHIPESTVTVWVRVILGAQGVAVCFLGQREKSLSLGAIVSMKALPQDVWTQISAEVVST